MADRCRVQPVPLCVAPTTKTCTMIVKKNSREIAKLREAGRVVAVAHDRMQAALDLLWPYAGELDLIDDTDRAIADAGTGPDLAMIGEKAHGYRMEALTQATLVPPLDAAVRKGGKAGLHSEGFGFMLAEMQVLQRSHPGVKW